MRLRLMLMGYIVGRNTKKRPGVPGMPLLTAYLRQRGELEIKLDEEKRNDNYSETCYTLSVDGENVATYRVREQGSLWSELFGREGSVVRNVLVTLEEGLGMDISNFEGTHCQDLVRLIYEYEKAGIFAEIAYSHQAPGTVSNNNKPVNSD